MQSAQLYNLICFFVTKSKKIIIHVRVKTCGRRIVLANVLPSEFVLFCFVLFHFVLVLFMLGLLFGGGVSFGIVGAIVWFRGVVVYIVLKGICVVLYLAAVVVVVVVAVTHAVVFARIRTFFFCLGVTVFLIRIAK